MSALWRQRHKHVFILSDTGRPIFSRYGMDEKDAPAILATVQALVSRCDDMNDDLSHIEWNRSKLVAFRSSGLVFIIISRNYESVRHLRRQLEALHAVCIFTLSADTLSAAQRDSRLDLQRQISGLESTLHYIIRYSNRTLTISFNAAPILPLPKSLRSDTRSSLKYCGACSDLIFAVLIAGTDIVAFAQGAAPGSQDVYALDVWLLATFVQSHSSLRSAEAWMPICLPRHSPTRFVHALVAYVGSACRARGRTSATACVPSITSSHVSRIEEQSPRQPMTSSSARVISSQQESRTSPNSGSMLPHAHSFQLGHSAGDGSFTSVPSEAERIAHFRAQNGRVALTPTAPSAEPGSDTGVFPTSSQLADTQASMRSMRSPDQIIEFVENSTSVFTEVNQPTRTDIEVADCDRPSLTTKEDPIIKNEMSPSCALGSAYQCHDIARSSLPTSGVVDNVLDDLFLILVGTSADTTTFKNISSCKTKIMKRFENKAILNRVAYFIQQTGLDAQDMKIPGLVHFAARDSKTNQYVTSLFPRALESPADRKSTLRIYDELYDKLLQEDTKLRTIVDDTFSNQWLAAGIYTSKMVILATFDAYLLKEELTGNVVVGAMETLYRRVCDSHEELFYRNHPFL